MKPFLPILLATLSIGSATGQVLLRTVQDPTPYTLPLFVKFPGAIASADVDGDGIPDMIVGAPREGYFQAMGQVCVFSGATGLLLYTITDPSPATGPGVAVDHFGEALAVLPDVDGDGHPDFAVGSPNTTPAGGATSGPNGVRAYSGLTGAPLWFANAGPGPAAVGRALLRLRDFDGDGKDDLAVVGDQILAILSSATGATLNLSVFPNGGPFGVFSASVIANAGDVDGDGFTDVAVGAKPSSLSSSTGNPGRILIFSGLTTGVIRAIDGNGNERLGAALAGIGDVNGDGVPDLLAGAPGGESLFGPEPGSARILSGLTGAVLSTIAAPPGALRFGSSVAALGDLNGDGVSEFIIGSTGATARARLYSGNGNVLLATIGDPAAPFSLERIAALPDQDGDGTIDFAAGGQERVLVFGSHRAAALSASGPLTPGSVLTLDVAGQCASPVVLVADTEANGYDAGPFGQFALSFSPALTVLVDGTGLFPWASNPLARIGDTCHWSVNYTLPAGGISGVTLYTQGVVFDGFQIPGLYSISNAVTLAF